MAEITCIQCYGVGKIIVKGKVVDCDACDGKGTI